MIPSFQKSQFPYNQKSNQCEYPKQQVCRACFQEASKIGNHGKFNFAQCGASIGLLEVNSKRDLAFWSKFLTRKTHAGCTAQGADGPSADASVTATAASSSPNHLPHWPPPPPPLTPRGPHYLTLVNRSQNRVIDLVQIFWLSGGRSSWEWAPITLIWKGHSLLLFTQPCLSWTLLSNVLRFEPNWGYIFGRRFYGVLTSDYQCIAWHCCNILGGFNKHLSRLSRLSYTPKPSSWLR